MNVDDGINNVLQFLKNDENNIQAGFSLSDDDFINLVGTKDNINAEVENELLHNLRYFYKKPNDNKLYITRTGIDFIMDMS